MLVSMSIGYLLMYLPLLVAVSLVIGASRHERRDLILLQSRSVAIWITTFMLGVYAVLQLVSWSI